MKTPLWVAILILCFELVVVLALIPDKHIDRLITNESALVTKRLGGDTANRIINEANSWYDDWIVRPGTRNTVMDFFIPHDDAQTTFGNTDLAPTYFTYMHDRIDTLFKSFYQLLTRVAQLAIWFPYMLIVFVPALFDGFMSWKIKRTSFDYPSPVLHRYALIGTFLLIVVTIALFILPFCIDPIIIPIFLILLSIFTGVAVGNMQKRL